MPTNHNIQRVRATLDTFVALINLLRPGGSPPFHPLEGDLDRALIHNDLEAGWAHALRRFDEQAVSARSSSTTFHGLDLYTWPEEGRMALHARRPREGHLTFVLEDLEGPVSFASTHPTTLADAARALLEGPHRSPDPDTNLRVLRLLHRKSAVPLSAAEDFALPGERS